MEDGRIEDGEGPPLSPSAILHPPSSFPAEYSRRIARRAADTLLFALTLLLSAFLLFAVQPMIGKLLLPRLGGTPAVWNTCMLFFQVCLLGGYAYAHAVATRVPPRAQAIVHVALLIAAAFTLPIALGRVGDPPAERNPIPWLLTALLLTAGPAFFVVSSTAPLLQRWYAAGGRDPYFLYAASNIGSLAALLAYPFLIEPHFRLVEQSQLWTTGYLALLALIALCAVRTRVAMRLPTPVQSASAAPADPPSPVPAHPSRALRLRWIALAFAPSSYLLGVTTFISSDIAAVPLLWAVPLALYLLSFILVFATRPPLPHRLITKILPPALLAAVMFMMARASQPVWLVLAVHLLAFFIAAMACHGELARLRPPPARLTELYLMLSIGGALGGVFNAILAPVIFNRPIEYPIAIALAALFALPRRDAHESPRTRRLQEALDYILPLILGIFAVLTVRLIPARTVREALPLMLIFVAVPALLCWTFAARPTRFTLGVALLLLPTVLLPPAHARPLDVRRSFFGVHRILLTRDGQFIHLFHGTTMHGAQQADRATGKPIAPDRPTSYYYEGSPYAQVFDALAAQKPAPRVGVAGLGGGSLAGYAKAGCEMRFFEIDPVVVWAAEQSGHFTFVEAARARGATIENVLGDARLTIAREPDRSFDLIALDAFSGDSIPVHLLTREAVAMYLTKLREDGVLVIHISNLYLDLQPAVAALAADAKCVALVRDDNEPTPEQRERGATGSRVVVMSRSPQALAPLAEDARWRPLALSTIARPWTDDFSNLVEIIRWSRPPE